MTEIQQTIKIIVDEDSISLTQQEAYDLMVRLISIFQNKNSSQILFGTKKETKK